MRTVEGFPEQPQHLPACRLPHQDDVQFAGAGVGLRRESHPLSGVLRIADCDEQESVLQDSAVQNESRLPSSGTQDVRYCIAIAYRGGPSARNRSAVRLISTIAPQPTILTQYVRSLPSRAQTASSGWVLPAMVRRAASAGSRQPKCWAMRFPVPPGMTARGTASGAYRLIGPPTSLWRVPPPPDQAETIAIVEVERAGKLFDAKRALRKRLARGTPTHPGDTSLLFAYRRLDPAL